MKMLIIITVSSHSPANFDNSPIPKASPPADKVPNALLSPLLRVAPAGVIISEKLTFMHVLTQ